MKSTSKPERMPYYLCVVGEAYRKKELPSFLKGTGGYKTDTYHENDDYEESMETNFPEVTKQIHAYYQYNRQIGRMFEEVFLGYAAQ